MVKTVETSFDHGVRFPLQSPQKGSGTQPVRERKRTYQKSRKKKRPFIKGERLRGGSTRRLATFHNTFNKYHR